MPRYDVIPLDRLERLPAPLGVPLGAGEAWAGVAEAVIPGSDVPVCFLDHLALFGSRVPPRPARLRRVLAASCGSASYAAARSSSAKYLGWFPDVIHVHDWPTALIPVYLNTLEAHGPLAGTASVLTIHNLAHQSKFPAKDLAATHIPPSELRPDSLEDMGGVNPMKGGPLPCDEAHHRVAAVRGRRSGAHRGALGSIPSFASAAEISSGS